MDDAPEMDCPRLQGGGCALGEPASRADCDTASADDTGFDDTAEARLEGGGHACATVVAPSPLPLLVLAIVAFRRWWPALALLVAAGARAADAQQFSPGDGGAFAGLVEGGLGEPWEGRVALTTSYATDVAVLRSGEDEWVLIPTVVTSEVGASLRIDRWFSVGVVVPEHLRVVYGAEPLRPLRGDVGVRVAVPLADAGGVRGNWSVQWDAPGPARAYNLGDQGAMIGRLALDADRGPLLVGTNLALRVQRPEELPGLVWANRFEYGFAASYGLRGLDLGAEVIGSVPVRGWSAAAMPAEAYATVRSAPRRAIALRAGVGAGIGYGLGAPGFRAFAGIDLTTREPRDPDGDGRIDLVDRCDREPEDLDHHADLDGCPDPDNDGDGLLDALDACPYEAEVVNAWEDDDGCPDELARVTLVVRARHVEQALVTVGEGPAQRVLEGEKVRIEVVPGERRLQVLATGHYPHDRDVTLVEGDQAIEIVLDPVRRDAYVPVHRPPVVAEADRIVVRDEIRFGLDDAEPTPDSADALQALAEWLNANPRVELVRVEGHADGIGGSRYNYELSLQRAEAVRKRLIALGVAPERLVAVGAGEARTEARGIDAASRKVGLLVLVWDDEQVARPEPPAP